MWWSTMTRAIEGAAALDPAVNAVAKAVNKVLPAGPRKDLLHGKPLGHALHPLLVALPIGMWSGASLLDLTGGKASRRAAQRLVGVGVLLAGPTAWTGWADWSELGQAVRPKRVGLVHAVSNGATAALYAASWLARARGDQRRGRNLALLGSAGLAVGGYLGGHLAYVQGVGVSRNAGVDPNPTDWTDAAAASDVADGKPMRVEVAGENVALVRQRGAVYAMGAVCSHFGGPMDEGAVQGDCLVCPWHGSEFRLDDGSVARGPATVPQPMYDVRLVGDRVHIKAR